ncbi:hypothetical protein [Pantanalinema sp. GBBB05]|uniref:hypothetical protein n=1 Tax=Pantanalinema sp. GBBB05 TaxID=2604139 RepID=UPI001E059A24|nr:hypothetical protein [Pantanalinema sp. GBBB05]
MKKLFQGSQNYPFLPYAQIRDRLKPGDVIAFSGKDFPSTGVKVATCSSFVHVAIVFQAHEPGSYEDSVLIAESHIDTSLPSVGTGKRILGVQLQWLAQRIAATDCPVWWAALKQPLNSNALSQMQQWLLEVEQRRIPYDFVQAIGAGFDLLDHWGLENRTDDSALFCSELVTRALQIAAVLDMTVNAAEQTPLDVMQFSCFQPIVVIKTSESQPKAWSGEVIELSDYQNQEMEA